MWNMDMLHRHVLTADTHYIVKIKLPSQIFQDPIMWYFNRKGKYSVKSGYYVAPGVEDYVTCCNICWFYSSVVLNLEIESTLQGDLGVEE